MSTTVLVVDDEPIVREVVLRYLERDGFRTLEAGDGDTARRLVESESPGLVIPSTAPPIQVSDVIVASGLSRT